MSRPLRWSSAVAATVLGFTALVAVSPRPDARLKARHGFSSAAVAERPARELLFAEADGNYRIPAELQLERDVEYNYATTMRRFASSTSLSSNYDKLKADFQVRAMLRAEKLESEGPGEPSPAAALGARASTWRSLGPHNLGGRTHAIVIDPTNPDTMFAGGIAGGVWKSTDAGASWSPLNDTLGNIGIASLAMDPTDPKVVYAGTGDIVDRVGRTGSAGAGAAGGLPMDVGVWSGGSRRARSRSRDGNCESRCAIRLERAGRAHRLVS